MSSATTPGLTQRRVPVVDATPENVEGLGVLLGIDVPNAGLPIPFYEGSVVEGHNLPFSYHGRVVVRMARSQKRSNEVKWLERHVRMTQLFVGLGGAPFVMVLAKPSHARGSSLPDVGEIVALRFAPGHGVLIHEGTWHDFPMACAGPVTVLTVNSEEVVDALASTTSAKEMDAGDVLKIDVPKRLGARIVVEMP